MPGIVTLVSGGLDSTLMAVMAREQRVKQFPLFVNYGQLCADRELRTCLTRHRVLSLPKPTRMALSGFGRRVPSGITSRKLRIREDAFLPGRNLLLLLVGAAYAVSKRADAVCIGLLNDANRLFPDQTTDFLGQAEGVIRVATMSDVRVVAPLAEFDKKSVITLAARRGITGTYSCHSGRARRCGKCVSCLERIQAEEER